MSQHQFSLDRVLYHFNETEAFTIRQACEGVQIFGGIGSGKTSGSGASLARAYLKVGFGGLILCAKKDELATWQHYARETGREEQLIVMDATSQWCFPFLQYEVSRDGEGAGYTENLVRLFITVYEAIDRGQSGGGADPYWMRAMQQLIRNTIDLALLSEGTVSVPMMAEIVSSAPRSQEERDAEEWRGQSYCYELLTKASVKERDKWEQQDFISTVMYWMEEYTNLAPRTRSGIVSMFTSMADNFLRRPFRRLFSETPEDWKHILYPELTHKGALIVLNLPVKEFGSAGRAAQIVYKYVWQQAAERRNITDNPRPVFLWVDEAQNFCNDYDMHFQATARSSRACTVYLTQNLPNYYAEFSGENGRHRVDSLIGNLQTRIWHSNSEPQTNLKAADTVGKNWLRRRGEGSSIGMNSMSVSESFQESFNYQVAPEAFTRLRKGGPANDLEVDGYLFQNGRIWSNGKTYLKCIFKQQ